MTPSDPSYILNCTPEDREAIEPLIRDFVAQCRSKSSPRIEDFLQRYSGDHPQFLLHELLLEEIEHRSHAGELPKQSDYSNRFPEFAEVLQFIFDRQLDAHSEPSAQEHNAPHPEDEQVDALDVPKALGRYRVIKKIGRGGFGTVYLAHDPDLDRNVAIKLPRRDRFQSLVEMDLFVQEARTTAKLGGHPGIVTLYDIQTLGESICIIQEFVNGHDLRTWLHAHPHGLPIDRCVEIITAVGAALAFAHEKGFYHRDLKPDNILIDTQGVPRIADFGLAIHEDQQRKRKGDQSGSPHYMSPERIRGESHRIDGRSDLWSLGVVLYELLSGRRPFQGETREALAEEICQREPVPIRQWRPEVPSELDRICTKCLSKHKSDRYPTAHDLLEDLHWWTTHRTSTPATNEAVSALASIPSPTPFPTPLSSGQRRPLGNSYTPSSGSSGSGGTPWPKAMPKGLRAFDREDREFFLELLPGPHDRHGLPESIRFWKSRIEALQPDRTFAVGLLYGPSGCGKTSLVKAGLLPRLADHVRAIYIGNFHAPLEATLKKSLLRMFPDLPRDSDAAELLQTLCRGGWLANDQKLLLVFDQFEQWLHTTLPEDRQPVIDALRQCDGSHVQSLLMARADFWMQTTRFMRELEAPIAEGENIAAVDLFSISHAKKVLELFGRAYGRFPGNGTIPLSHEQQAFLEQSLRSLSDEDKVIPVKLALFAELLKEQPWTPTTLETVGGLEGLGSLFLEQTFDAKHADAESKHHQTAARGVLRALLPDGSGSIRSSQKTLEDLRGASGYGNRDKELQSLIELLDRKLRLITPVLDDSVVQSDTNEPNTSQESSALSYQLAHDYLIPSLRDWLQRKQRETPRGRAEIALEDRTAIWKHRRENKHLPTLLEWLAIHRWVPKRLWTPVQHDAMRAADRMHWIRIGVASLGSIALGATAWTVQKTRQEKQRSQTAERIAKQELLSRNLMAIAKADANEILSELDRILPKREEYDDELRKALVTAGPQSQTDLNYRLALFAWDPSQKEELIKWVEKGSPKQIATVLLRFRSEEVSLSQAERQRAQVRLTQLWINGTEDFLVAFQELQKLLGSSQAIAEIQRNLGDIEPTSYSSDDPESVVKHVTQFRERAIAAVGLENLLQFEDVNRFLTVDDDPEAITQFVAAVSGRIERADCLAVHLSQLLELEIPTDTRLRQQHFLRTYAILLAIGQFAPDRFSVTTFATLVSRLEQEYEKHPSRAVHSATGWLLRSWGKLDAVIRVDRTPLDFDPNLNREWFVIEISPSLRNPATAREFEPKPSEGEKHDRRVKIYINMLAIPARKLSSDSSNDRAIATHLSPHVLAVSDREITWGSFGPFATKDQLNRVQNFSQQKRRDTMAVDDPVIGVNLWDASLFCVRISNVFKVRRDFNEIPLSEANYFRLPIETEWEFLANGGMRTPYSFGSDASVMEQYGWIKSNSQHWKPVALKAPNPFGLFDVHGNVSEWTCNDPTQTLKRSEEAVTNRIDPTGGIFSGLIDPNLPAQTFSLDLFNLSLKPNLHTDKPNESARGSNWTSDSTSWDSSPKNGKISRNSNKPTIGFRIVQTLSTATGNAVSAELNGKSP